MANPTTYFGWVMPNSADLVTDLPADFNVFGQGVDTSMQYLLGGTTGQVLSKTSGTNMAFTWVTPTDQTPLTTKGDLFAFSTVDARLAVGANETRLVADSVQATGLKYVADTTNYAINAKGDLLGGTAADTLIALSVGANDTVLTADSTAATGMKWATPSAGGMTVLASGSLSGSSLALTSISQAYTDLRLNVYNFNGGTTGYTVSISTINGNGNTAYIKDTASARALDGTFNTTPTQINSLALTNNAGSNVFQFELFNYSSAVPHQGQFYLGAGQASGGPQQYFQAGSFYNQNSSAVTALTFAISTGTFNAGTYILYGVK